MRGPFILVAIVLACALAVQLPIQAAADDPDAAWTVTTLLSGLKYQNVDLEIGKRNIYVMTWEYYEGPIVMLQRSDCWGSEWETPTNVFGEGLWNAFPAMCCYANGSQDELLIAAGSDIVSKSYDSGATFERLAPLPIPEGCQDWRYLAVGTNASWFGGEVDSDIYVLGALYVGEYWTGTHMIAFTKSTDWGNTWSEPVFLCPDEARQCNYPEVISDGSRLYVPYTKINLSLEGSSLALKWSDDWGATWSEELPIPVSTPLGVAATGLQYFDEDKAILTVSTNAHEPLECTGKIGYFHFADCSYEILCEMSGPEWCIAAGSFEGELSKDGVYHAAWAYEPVLSEPMELRYGWSRDVPFTGMDCQTPLVMGNPPDEPGQDGSYSSSFHGTVPDMGDGKWELESNADWLEQTTEADGSCVVKGTPTATGEFWVNVSVTDDDSTDSFNYTVAVTQAFPGDPTDDDTGEDETDDTGTIDIWLLAAAGVACGAVVVAVAVLVRRRP